MTCRVSVFGQRVGARHPRTHTHPSDRRLPTVQWEQEEHKEDMIFRQEKPGEHLYKCTLTQTWQVWTNDTTVKFPPTPKEASFMVGPTFTVSCRLPSLPRPPPLSCCPPLCCGGGHSQSCLWSDAGSASWCPPGRGCWPACRAAASACAPSWHWTLWAVSCPAGPAGSLKTIRHHDRTSGMSDTQAV